MNSCILYEPNHYISCSDILLLSSPCPGITELLVVEYVRQSPIQGIEVVVSEERY